MKKLVLNGIHELKILLYDMKTV